MPAYVVPASQYRASTGSMPVPIIKTSNSRNARTGQYVEECSSCGSSYSDEHTIPLNTPFSTSPTSPTGPMRVSFSSEKRPVVVSAGHPTVTSLPPPGQVLRRYQNGALVYEPASSLPIRKERHGRRASISSHPNNHHHHQDEHRHRHGHASAGQWHHYQHEIDIRNEQQGVRGYTKIPRKLVNKEAVRESGLPWQEEEGTGAIVIFRALSRPDIEKLVQRTEALRALRREKHVRIIPEPTQMIPPANSRSHEEQSRRSEEKIARAEERAKEAHEKAIKKEYRAEITHSYSDEIKARKARAEAEEKARQVEEVIIKERHRREDREKSYSRGAIRVAKGPREVVIVR